LFALSLVKNTLHPTAPQHITILALSYDFQVLVLFILQASNNNHKNPPNHHLTTEIFCISIVFLSQESGGILTLPPQNTPIHHSTRLCSSTLPFFSFPKDCKNKKTHVIIKKKKKRERPELELAFSYLNLEGSHLQSFLYLERW